MGRGWGGEDGGPLDGAARVVVEVGVLTRRRPGHMVDLERKRGTNSEEEKLRTGSATDVSTVKKDRHGKVRVQP
jgi:hypothetical protein